ncbi:MAG TPA: adenylate/guanylate cyclase domain-containing protein [Kofleriaceae bacterium]|nr:adenylate/guanylate cyclase domain-containing protein [Kofleriaceae bacterium]
MTRHMIAKIFLAIALVVGLALLYQTARDTRREVDMLKGETRHSAETIARMIIGAVEHAMLQGEGIQVKALIAELVQRTPEARVEVYDQRGIEVFAPLPPPPPPAEIPPPVRAALSDGQRREVGDVIYRPVPSEVRCRECHADSSALRGLLAIEVDRAGCAAKREDALVRLVEGGFLHIMTARKSELLDDYFGELSAAAPGVRAAAVYDVEGDLAFGAAIDGLTPEQVVAAARPGAPASRTPSDGGTLDLVPLPWQERCVSCHDRSRGPVRGVLALSLAPRAGPGCQTQEIEAVVDRSLRFIMLSQLGRRIADFLDAAAGTGALRRLELYDSAGRRYWTTRHPAPPPRVADVLARKSGMASFLGDGASERSLVIEPLVNRPGCRRCHGESDELRGVVSVSLSTAMAARMRAETIAQRTWFSAGTLLAILIILVGVLQYFVLRPVKQIGQVADAVGEGNLGVSVARADAAGDEVARLGHRINHMVSGLRAKSQLERFVSRGAAHAAEMAGLRGVARLGERRRAAVMFSDIRGFTTFSETVSPEEVVEMLNRMLDAQARVVVAHGGDIDKFVGDALMAVFQGQGAERRAVASAVEMVAAVHDARVAGEVFSVGIGVACGEVVYGAMGSEARMDFTVIGDVVNTGARLCSAADADEVLVTDPVARACADSLAAIELVPHEPLQVRGKREPVIVHAARRR